MILQQEKGSYVEILWHALSLVASLALPLVGWLGKSYLKLHDRQIKTETLLEERTKTLDRIDKVQAVDTHRITQSEGAIDQLKTTYQEMRVASEQRHREITEKLEILPEIGATLKGLQRICETIVPRDEIEARLESQDDRIRDVALKQK